MGQSVVFLFATLYKKNNIYTGWRKSYATLDV